MQMQRANAVLAPRSPYLAGESSGAAGVGDFDPSQSVALSNHEPAIPGRENGDGLAS